MFKDIKFPSAVNIDVKVTRRRKADNVTTLSGDIYANEKWLYTRRKISVGWGPKTRADMQLFLDLWENVRTAHTFRFKDDQDYSSAAMPGGQITKDDQPIGVGDAAETAFQLLKAYSYGAETSLSPIYAPVDGTVLIALDGVLQASPGDYTVDHSTGIVTFAAPPGNGVVITAGYEYDLKVRFANDAINQIGIASNVQEIDVFTLLEDPRQ